MQEKARPSRTARMRFYQELNDFLPEGRRKRLFTYTFTGTPAVKDAVEAVGVPHTEIDLILVDGHPVPFSYRISGGETISVYPVFESLDISSVTRLRAEPLRVTRFILDVHLGRLSRLLRLFGFDTLYRNDLDDPEIIDISIRERRIILTRDKGILKNGRVTHGYWVRNIIPEQQLIEVLRRFQLEKSRDLFSRCMKCNGIIKPVDKQNVLSELEPGTRRYYDEFFRCDSCKTVYWKGSHYHKLTKRINAIISEIHNSSC